MKTLAVLIALVGSYLVGAVTPAFADQNGCIENVDVTSAEVVCDYSETGIGGEASENGVVSNVGTSRSPVYTVEIICLVKDGACFSPRICDAGDGPGVLYTLLKDGRAIGVVCLNAEEAMRAEGQPVPTTEMVLREFKRLSWPTAELMISPPNGRTLVNLPTIFSTGLGTGSQTQTVTLLGQQVTIEATPTTYTWHAGDGTSWVTAHPGTPYSPGAEVAALNTHVYLDGSAFVAPSVDVTYAGRYRVGGGQWISIPETLTLPGRAVSLEVVAAANRLIAR